MSLVSLVDRLKIVVSATKGFNSVLHLLSLASVSAEFTVHLFVTSHFILDPFYPLSCHREKVTLFLDHIHFSSD